MSSPTVGPPASGVTALEVDGRVSVYSPTGQELVALNDTASDLWRLCDGEHRLDDIVQLLASSYQVETSVIDHDVRQAVDEMVSLGLLTVRRP